MVLSSLWQNNIVPKLSLSAMQDLDVTGMTLAHKPSEVLTKKGAKAIHGKTSTSRELITVIACGNAAGDYLHAAAFLFLGKTRRKLDGCDIESTMERSSSIKGANFSAFDSGWTNCKTQPVHQNVLKEHWPIKTTALDLLWTRGSEQL